MNTKDRHINDSNFRKLVHNEDYYRNIFKKTEKIISVVFYILNNIDHNKKSETHISNIASKAHFAHEHALRSLEVKMVNAKEVLEQFAQSLIALDSTLRIAGSSGILHADVQQTVSAEIDVVLRSLSRYMSSETGLELNLSSGVSASASTTFTPSGHTRTTLKKASSRTAVQNNTADRRTRIRTILEAKGEATIKDISEIITDCSEKTIQRELNAMIEDNLVKRHGERRWSKYSIV